MDFWDTLGRFITIADIITFGVAGFAAFQSLRLRQETKAERARQNQMIPIVLREIVGEGSRGRVISLPEMRRADLTRGELLGLVGMVPMIDPKERFNIAYLKINSTVFFDTLEKIQNSATAETWYIDVSPTEMNQFAAEAFTNATPPVTAESPSLPIS